MWLCTKIGFFSIVHKAPATVHIRGRSREDLEALAAAASLPPPVASYPRSDYPWRILCPAELLPAAFAALSASIDYPNFKSAIAASPSQIPKLAAYHDIHHRMVEWRQEQKAR